MATSARMRVGAVCAAILLGGASLRCGGTAAPPVRGAEDSIDAGGSNDGMDSGSDAPDGGDPVLSYAPTNAQGCEALQPRIGTAPATASRKDDHISCGLPYDADLHGRAVYGCWDPAPDGGPVLLVVEDGGNLRGDLVADARQESFWGAAAPDGVIGEWSWPDGGNGDVTNAIALADGHFLVSTASDHIGFAYDFEAGLLLARRSPGKHTWQRVSDLGVALTLEVPVPAPPDAAAYSAAIDANGNVLAAWIPGSGGQMEAHWYDGALAPIGDSFPLGVDSFPSLQPIAGGGFAASASAENPEPWAFVVRPGESRVDAVPAFRTSRKDRAFALVFSGEAFAFIDESCPTSRWPCPTAAAEIVAADGVSCGVLTLRRPDGSPEPFIVTRAGTVIDAVQGIVPDPRSPVPFHVSRWWPNVLRRP